MDSKMVKFLEEAKARGLCKEYTEMVDKAGSKKALLDIALDPNGIEYVCKAVCKGYLDADYISEAFAPFNNGRYVKNVGYTSSMYCQPTTELLETKTTATLIIGYRGRVVIPHICELYLCNSEVSIEGEGTALCYLYNSKIVSTDKAEARIKENKRYGTEI